ncbi:dopamine N-acetyltransferase-like [Cimex lectularius]|uniref:aralkylamine N-acetyltransferase n=1 Tax=Cimex lectularius TaxID=79782 RepID=A0A8I6TB47_CIMLE|nr:dopamine N-acetyltransferase-like [Cimex lectularius]
MYGLPWIPGSPPFDAISHLPGARPPITTVLSEHNLRLIPVECSPRNPPSGIEMDAPRGDDIDLVSPVPDEYYDRVIYHLRNNFFADEPLNNSVGLCQRGESNEELEKLSISTLKDRLSVMAINSNNEVIAVVLNGVLTEKDLDESLIKLENNSDEKCKTIFRVLYRLNHSLQLFKKYKVDKMFECRILSVDAKYRGLGLANKLIIRSEELAKDFGFKVFKTDSTGLFSQRTLMKLGHEAVFEVNYEDIKDENGEQIFKTKPPHTCLKIMTKILD